MHALAKFGKHINRVCASTFSDKPRSLDTCPVIELSLVVPVYNEAATVGLFLERVNRALGDEPSVRLEAVFVNDGSADATLDCLLAYQQRDTRVRVVDLSRNFGVTIQVQDIVRW